MRKIKVNGIIFLISLISCLFLGGNTALAKENPNTIEFLSYDEEILILRSNRETVLISEGDNVEGIIEGINKENLKEIDLLVLRSMEEETDELIKTFINKSSVKKILLPTLNGVSEEEFLLKLEEKFQITKLNKEDNPKPKHKGEFGMCINGDWFKLEYKDKNEISLIEKTKIDLVKNLDVSILQDNILEPILGIKDVRNDERIYFVGGIRGLKELERRVSEDMKVAFALYPTSLEEVMKISD